MQDDSATAVAARARPAAKAAAGAAAGRSGGRDTGRSGGPVVAPRSVQPCVVMPPSTGMTAPVR
jgi:hypothetical protein